MTHFTWLKLVCFLYISLCMYISVVRLRCKEIFNSPPVSALIEVKSKTCNLLTGLMSMKM